MNPEKEPLPLADPESEASDRVRALIQSSRRDVPTHEQLGALESRLAPLLWPAGGGGTGSSAPSPDSSAPTAVGMGAGAKVGALLIAAALAGGGLFIVNRSHDAAAPAAREPAGNVATKAPAAAVPENTQPNVEPQNAVPATPAPATSPRAGKAAAQPSEAELLYAARASVETNPRQALKLVDEHRRRFPSGVLTQEREVIAIDALKRLGRSEEATERAERFKERYPDSAHRSKIDGYVQER